MDIYILHEGQESGPYSEKSVSQLLQQGGIVPGDLAWRSGLSEWAPVSEVLAEQPVTASPEATPTRPAAKTQMLARVDKAETVDPADTTDKADKATPKQKALLSFLRIAFPADLLRDQASRLVNDAMEDPSNAERLTLWNAERFRLHPDLFAAEIQAKKENRANHFFELCQSAGADYFQEITKAHCQVLVSFLDVKFPHWDARESAAAEHYFYPAVAEKFPQLVQKQWRGRLHYTEGHKVAPEMVHKSAASKSRSTSASALAAVTRGLVLGVAILGMLYLGYRTMRQDLTAAPPENAAAMAGETPPAPAALPATAPSSAPIPTPADHTASAVASTAPAPDVAPVAPLTAPIPAPAEPGAAPGPGLTAVAPVPEPALPVLAAAGSPPMAGNPAPPMAGDAVPPMATLPSTAGVPPAAPTDPSGMTPNSTSVNTAPMATLPGSEPPGPVPPPPATMPVAGTLPSLPPEALTIPPLPATPEPGATPAAPPMPATSGPVAKTQLLLMRPVEIQLAYGKIMLPPGTAVKLVSRQGGILKVSYRDSVISVPATSTDID